MSWRSSPVRLHGETQAAARERYRYYLQQALACIHPTAQFYMSKTPLAEDWALATNPAPISLRGSKGSVLYLTAAQSFRLRKHKGEWKVSTQEYIYNVGETEDTR